MTRRADCDCTTNLRLCEKHNQWSQQEISSSLEGSQSFQQIPGSSSCPPPAYMVHTGWRSTPGLHIKWIEPPISDDVVIRGILFASFLVKYFIRRNIFFGSYVFHVNPNFLTIYLSRKMFRFAIRDVRQPATLFMQLSSSSIVRIAFRGHILLRVIAWTVQLVQYRNELIWFRVWHKRLAVCGDEWAVYMDIYIYRDK